MTDRPLQLYVHGRAGLELRGATLRIFLDQEFFGEVDSSSGPNVRVPSPGVISIVASYPGQADEAVTLASDQDNYTFTFPVDEDSRIMSVIRENVPAVLGVGLVVVAVLMVTFLSNPSPIQKQVILGLFALGGGGVGSVIPGLLNVKLKLGAQLAVTAAGAMAIFALLYFYPPALLS